MKSAVAAIGMLGLLLVMPVQAASELPEAGEEWLVLQRQGNTYREVFSVVSDLPPLEVRARFHVLLRFTWCYASLPNGMPAEEELIRARELYVALDGIIGSTGLYAMTRTGGGERTIYYYVEDAKVLARAIGDYFDSLPPLSVEVRAREEPGWDSVKEVLEAVKY